METGISNQRNLSWRREVMESDQGAVENLLRTTGFFYGNEIEVAKELVEAGLTQGEVSGYDFLFAEYEGQMIGYGCFGPIPLTSHRFDIYWLAVAKAWQDQGIGRQLLSRMEQMIRGAKGGIIYIETAGRPLYEPTRQFYLRQGYLEVARIPDYYADGDDRIVFMKKLSSSAP